MTVSKRRKVDYDLIAKLYEQGYVDREIAARVGCYHNTVFAWRKKYNLHPNRTNKGK